MEKQQVYMDVEVVLGNPRLQCDGYGICKFITKSSTLNRYCMNLNQLVKAKLDIQNGCLCLRFDKNSISDSAYNKYFAGGVFKVESDLLIPREITQFFQIPPSVLMKGVYQMDKYGNELKVSILIRNVEHTMLKMQTIAA